MRSFELSRVLELDRDLPTTAEDVAALRSAARLTKLDFLAYLRFLEAFAPPSAPALREKPGPRSDKAFEIVP